MFDCLPTGIVDVYCLSVIVYGCQKGLWPGAMICTQGFGQCALSGVFDRTNPPEPQCVVLLGNHLAVQNLPSWLLDQI
jgi:hypothetical protein